MRLTVSEDGECSLDELSPDFGTAVIRWRQRDVDIALLGLKYNGHVMAIHLHVTKQDDNPKRDFVYISLGSLTYRVYRDGWVVTE